MITYVFDLHVFSGSINPGILGLQFNDMLPKGKVDELHGKKLPVKSVLYTICIPADPRDQIRV